MSVCNHCKGTGTVYIKACGLCLSTTCLCLKGLINEKTK